MLTSMPMVVTRTPKMIERTGVHFLARRVMSSCRETIMIGLTRV